MKMIDKKLFCAVIDEMREEYDMQIEINDVFRKYKSDSQLIIDTHTATLLLLKKVMNDEDDWIGWFCFETNFGRDKGYKAYNADKSEIDLSTAEKLYDFLRSSYEI